MCEDKFLWKEERIKRDRDEVINIYCITSTKDKKIMNYHDTCKGLETH